MSAVCVLSPAVVAAWPAISAAVVGAAAALGMSVAREARAKVETMVSTNAAVGFVEVAVEHSEVVGETLATEEQAVLVKGNIRLRVFRDARGQVRVSAQGVGHSPEELQALAEELVHKMTQVFVYNKLMTELRNRGYTVVREEVGEDAAVRIHVRQAV